MIPERRRAIRTLSTVPFEFYDEKNRTVIGKGACVNFSETGAMLTTRTSLPPRKTIRLHVGPAGKSPLQLLGRVVWAVKNQPGFTYGIRFKKPASPSRRRKKKKS